MARLGIVNTYRLRSELKRLRAERKKLLHLAGAAMVLIHDLDRDTYESYEAAELVADCLERLPAPVKDEVLDYSGA